MAKIQKFTVPFTQVPNAMIQKSGMSLKAIGLYAYIQSKPDDYEFSADRISKDVKDGEDSIRSGLNELIEYGYLERMKMPNGRIVLQLFEKPNFSKPKQGKTQLGFIPTISNKESVALTTLKFVPTEVTDETNKDPEAIAPEAVSKPKKTPIERKRPETKPEYPSLDSSDNFKIVYVLTLMWYYGIDTSLQYGRPAQRKAALELFNVKGNKLDKVLAGLAQLPETEKKYLSYFTPVKFLENYAMITKTLNKFYGR